jgi:hypothetical protein
MPLSSVIGSSSIMQPGVCTSTTRPASPYDGQVIYETDTDKTLVWNGTGWVFLSTSRANPGGLDLIKTQTIGSAVSSVTVTDAFSSTYENYRVVVTGVAYSSNGTASYLKLNNSTGSTYYGNMVYNVPGTSAIAGVSAINGSNLGFFSATGSSTGTVDFDATVSLPFAAATANCVGNYGGRNYNGQFSGHDSNAASSTGFIIAPGAGTITGGTIRVYGYVNS